jgi:hypothetical protein
MSRSNYSDDYEDQWALICWRGAVESALRGRRGQAALKDLLTALDAMPQKALIAHDLERDGAYCALGVLGQARGLAMHTVDPEEPGAVATLFHLSRAFVQEIAYLNDEGNWDTETPAQRWRRMRKTIAALVST